VMTEHETGAGLRDLANHAIDYAISFVEDDSASHKTPPPWGAAELNIRLHSPSHIDLPGTPLVSAQRTHAQPCGGVSRSAEN
jgi:hypothetical protein